MLKQTAVPATVLPLMFVLNTVLVVALQRWLSRRAPTMAGAARAEQTAGFYLAATCACLAAASALSTVPAVIVVTSGVVLLTVGESLQIAASWELSHSHAPATSRGTFLAVFSISIGIQRSTGPAFVSLIALWGPLTWLPLAGAFAVTGAVMRRLAGQPWPPLVSAIQPGGEPPAGGRHPNPSLPASPSA